MMDKNEWLDRLNPFLKRHPEVEKASLAKVLELARKLPEEAEAQEVVRFWDTGCACGIPAGYICALHRYQATHPTEE